MFENKVKVLLNDSRLAFMNQQNDTALKLAVEAIKLDPKEPEAYKCAGDACMSLERYDKAVKNYRLAVKYDANNGNRYYDLGFALASYEKIADALKILTKADELGCTPDNLAQLYNILGIVCFDIGRYDDALINLDKAEQLIGINMEILERKIIIYGLQEDTRNGLMSANQIKLISPSEYIGYKYAFNLLVQSKRLEDAEKELNKAKKYATLTIDFYFDMMTLELEKYKVDDDKEHFNVALSIIEKALQTVKPTTAEVVDSYINAAELHLQLENADRTIDCLHAAQNPAGAYNNGFEISVNDTVPVTLSEYDIEDMIEADKQKINEELGEYGLDELAESIYPDEDGNREYFTEVEDEVSSSTEAYTLNESEGSEVTSENMDQINRLYIGAYTLKKDFEKVIEYAKVIQSSENLQSLYIGKYTEANAMKQLGLPDALAKYDAVIKFFRNAMIKDPTDLLAATLRVQCYIDIEKYTEAEDMCNLLNEEVKKPLLEQINEAKSGGDLN
jgi:tetratricopeptide (TPR) repeat protein